MVCRFFFTSPGLWVMASALACGCSELLPPGDAGDGAGGAGPAGTFLDGDLGGALPPTLEELGLFPDPSDRARAHARASLFEPRYPLWSNGSEKQRFVVVPRGQVIRVARGGWEFPVGTLFFKTFSYPDGEGGALRPVETRVLRQTEAGAEFSVYLWNEAGTSASLTDGRFVTRVPVRIGAEDFEHEVPSRLQCRSCHESKEPHVLGFDELRLNVPLAGGAATQLVELARAGVLDAAPDAPEALPETDAATDAVLGYLEGNCTHCHNGGAGPASAFDLRYPVALQNLIGVETTSELLRGLRVAPGSPATSALYLALTAEPEDVDAQPMPPLGVQRRDRAALELFEGWIESLEP